jgi:hypothetical protein
MKDERNDLIAEQALKISKLEKQVAAYKEACSNIVGKIYCIGGPLNDNCKQYNKEQLADWWYVVHQAENVCEDEY